METTVKVTISDENKRRIDFQVTLEQLDACYHTTIHSAKQERVCKMLKTKMNATYDTDTRLVQKQQPDVFCKKRCS